MMCTAPEHNYLSAQIYGVKYSQIGHPVPQCAVKRGQNENGVVKTKH